MKSKSILFLTAIIICVGFVYTGCSDDDETVLAKISGTVTYPSGSDVSMPAMGAVVKVYKGTSAAGEYSAVITDSMGGYKLNNLEAGDYFLVANYNTKNKNNLKAGVEGISFMSVGITVSLGSAAVTQNIVLANISAVGADVISTSSKLWAKEAHSKVAWETLYHGDAAVLAGGFNNFGLKQLEFDQAKPENTIIKGWVQLSSINTFEPGRDKIDKCVPASLGVKYNKADTAANGSLNLATCIDKTTDSAFFNSKSVKAYGDGFMAKGELIFKGVTKPIDMYFIYNGIHLIPKSAGGSDPFAVFEGEFTFKATTDYMVTYSGGDEVKVKIHLQMKGPAVL